MNRYLATSFALIATTIILPIASATAQSRDADIRFEAAQRRFDGELAMFKAEVERYERARTATPQISEAPPPAAGQQQVMSDPLVRSPEASGGDAPATDERDERGNEPQPQ